MIMPRDEIIRSYREAKKKKAQINILADLNRVSPKEMRAYLQEEGVLQAVEKKPPVLDTPKPLVSPEPLLSKQAFERALRLMKLVEQGASIGTIAHNLGVPFSRAMTLVAMLCTCCEDYISQAEEKEAAP